MARLPSASRNTFSKGAGRGHGLLGGVSGVKSGWSTRRVRRAAIHAARPLSIPSSFVLLLLLLLLLQLAGVKSQGWTPLVRTAAEGDQERLVSAEFQRQSQLGSEMRPKDSPPSPWTLFLRLPDRICAPLGRGGWGGQGTGLLKVGNHYGNEATALLQDTDDGPQARRRQLRDEEWLPGALRALPFMCSWQAQILHVSSACLPARPVVIGKALEDAEG